MLLLLFSPFLFILPALGTPQSDCSKSTYNDCISIADPLVRQPHLIFPDNMNDIDLVCTTWNRFVDCLKLYTDNCFTETERRQFNKAVENPIESVHQMCTQSSYQKEYLQYAPCIKSTITEPSHCGAHYNLLVEQVSQGETISRSTLCCSHDRFKQCVLKETRRLCDGGAVNAPALQFSTHIIDKALSFLQEQCYNYIPNSGDCTSLTTHSDPLTSEVYPWSTIQQDMAAKEISQSRATPSRISPTQGVTTAWLPSSSLPVQPEVSSTQMLGSRTRPASFGRASSWSESPLSPTQGGISSTTASSPPDWATRSSWTPQTRNEATTWYPAAGNQISNEVEEPNQQGLIKPKNTGSQSGAFGFALGLFVGITVAVA